MTLYNVYVVNRFIIRYGSLNLANIGLEVRESATTITFQRPQYHTQKTPAAKYASHPFPKEPTSYKRGPRARQIQMYRGAIDSTPLRPVSLRSVEYTIPTTRLLYNLYY